MKKPRNQGTVFVIRKEEYEALIRESEKLNAIRKYIESNQYPTTSDIATLAGVEIGAKKNGQ